MMKKNISLICIFVLLFQVIFSSLLLSKAANNEYTRQNKYFIIEDNIIVGITDEGHKYIEDNKEITIPEGITEIAREVFRSLGLKKVYFNNTLVKIGEYAFADNNLTEIDLPLSAVDVADNAFEGNKLTAEPKKELDLENEEKQSIILSNENKTPKLDTVDDNISLTNDLESSYNDNTDVSVNILSSERDKEEQSYDFNISEEEIPYSVQSCDDGMCSINSDGYGKIVINQINGRRGGEKILNEAVYSLYNENNIEIDRAMTNSQGQVIFDYLKYGEYKVVYLTPPRGYATTQDEYTNFTFEITPCNTLYEHTFKFAKVEIPQTGFFRANTQASGFLPFGGMSPNTTPMSLTSVVIGSEKVNLKKGIYYTPNHKVPLDTTIFNLYQYGNINGVNYEIGNGKLIKSNLKTNDYGEITIHIASVDPVNGLQNGQYYFAEQETGDNKFILSPEVINAPSNKLFFNVNGTIEYPQGSLLTGTDDMIINYRKPTIKKEMAITNPEEPFKNYIILTVPMNLDKYNSLSVTDNPSTNLDIDYNTIKLTDNEGIDISNTFYSVIKNADGGFTIDFNKDSFASLSGKKFVIEYSAKAKPETTGTIENNATLSYIDVFGEQKEETVPAETKFYKQSFKKISSDNCAVIEGTEFILKNSEGKYLSSSNIGGGEWSYFIEDAEKFYSGSDGKFVINNLIPGKYYLYETKASSGYIKKNDPIEFNIIADNQDYMTSIYITNDKGENPPEEVIHKYDHKFIKKERGSEEPLQGAEFKIQNFNGKWLYQNGEEVIWTDYSEDATVFISDKNGEFTVKGLEEGEYILIETKPPKDYAQPKPTTFIHNERETTTNVFNTRNTIPQTGSSSLIIMSFCFLLIIFLSIKIKLKIRGDSI